MKELRLKHLRIGPLIDVAVCGAREKLVFAQIWRWTTCKECREKRRGKRPMVGHLATRTKETA